MSDGRKQGSDEQDAGAFRHMCLTFWPKVRAMLLRQGVDTETAEDIARETMLSSWRGARQLSGSRSGVSSWMFATARNLRIDRVRRQAGWQRFYEEFETTARRQAFTHEPARREHRPGDIGGAIGALAPEQLQVVQLSFIDGLSQYQIAQRLELPIDTVKARMRLAFEQLRRAMESGS